MTIASLSSLTQDRWTNKYSRFDIGNWKGERRGGGEGGGRDGSKHVVVTGKTVGPPES